MKFRYEAIDPATGNTQQGYLDADSAESAEQELSGRGWKIKSLATAVDQETSVDLNRAETEALLVQVAGVTSANLPLHAGLRAVANETPSSRLTTALHRLADALEGGQSLRQALENVPNIPPHARGLIDSAAESGRLSEVLLELLDFNNRRKETWLKLRSALAYPLFVTAVAFAVGIAVLAFVAPPMIELYIDFELELPTTTRIVVFLSDNIVGLTLLLPGVLALLLLVRLVAGRHKWDRMITSIPVIGTAIFWFNCAEYARLLALLLRYEIPLPEALELTSAAASNQLVGDMGNNVAARVAAGESLAAALESERRFPRLMEHLSRVSEKNNGLYDGLLTCAEILEGYVELRVQFMRAILPPILLIGILLSVFAIVAGLYGPMVNLIQGLA